MGLVLTDFRGTLPGVANYDLPSNAASEAIDCEFGGTVRAARFYSTTDGTLWPNKVYGQWFNSDTPNGILPSPMADDSIDRMYRVSAGKLQRALLSSAGSWVDVSIESPSVAMTITVGQPMTKFVAAGTPQEPVGTQADYEFKLVYMGKKGGQTYFSEAFTGYVTAYPNSQIIFEHQSNFQDSLNQVQGQLRHQAGWSQAEVNTTRIGLFLRRAGRLVCIATADDGDRRNDGDEDATSVTGSGALDAPELTSWVWNDTNKMSYETTVNDYSNESWSSTTSTTVISSPPAPRSYSASLQAVDGAGETPVADIPEGELGMSRAYVYTVCRIVGDNNGNQVVEEGPPSVPVIVNNVYSNSTIKIQFASNVPSGYTFAIYRAQAGMYLYVGDCIAGANTFEDNIPDAALGEECPSMDWLPPPTLQGVISTGYGFFVGWNQNRVYCSELYLPHAWPAGYSYTTKYNIRRCIATHNGILAITDNGNYFIAGSSPTGLNLVEMPTFHPCIGDMTAVDMGDGIVYAAPNGLALVTTSGSQLLTEGAIDPTWWASKDFSAAVAYRAGESCVITVGGETLVFNLRNKTIHTSTGMPTKATFDQATGNLQTSSGSISVSSLAPSYVWQSKVFEFNRMPTFGWTQCIATAYPVSVRWKLWTVLADGTADAVEHVVTYNDHHPKRFIPGAFHRVQARIESSNPVSKVVLTNNREELEYVG